MLIKGPAQNLSDYMIKLSQKHYATEWALGLEYELWAEIEEGPDILSNAEIEKLKDLSEWCGGWIAMDYSRGSETLELVDLNDWREKYRDNKPF
ncbi:MAG: hypothetical protein GY866_14045 [Proteobacteria bacterium]|nr:hypothetical protein [Pseudomonadota bacterium]